MSAKAAVPARRPRPLPWQLLKELPALVLAFPFLLLASYTLLAAFTPTGALDRGSFGHWTLANFQEAWRSANFPLLYRNTILFTGGLLLAQTLSVVTAGYALARMRFRFREGWFYLILLQLFFPPSALLIPNFLILSHLGLANSLTGLALPYVASATGTFLLRQGFRQIPPELEEAAFLDGATRTQVLVRILLPLVRPQLAAFALVSLVYHWNEFLWPLIFLQSPSKQVLSVGFVSFTTSVESGMEWGLIAAGALLVALPTLVAFVLFQGAFLRAFAQSGLKG